MTICAFRSCRAQIEPGHALLQRLTNGTVLPFCTLGHAALEDALRHDEAREDEQAWVGERSLDGRLTMPEVTW